MTSEQTVFLNKKNENSKVTILALGALPKIMGGNAMHGLATGVFDLVNAINELNTNITVILCAPDFFKKNGKVKSTTVIGVDKKKLLWQLLSNPVKLIRYTFLSLVFCFRFDLTFRSTLLRFFLYDYAISKVKPDLISAHGPARAILAMHLSKYGSKKVIPRIHGISGLDKKNANYKSAYKQEKYIAKQKFLAITHISNSDKKQWQKYYGKWQSPNEVILNGYQKNIFYVKNRESKLKKIENLSSTINNRIRLITVASIQPRKGQLRVVKALSSLGNMEKFEYVCIGEGAQIYKNKIITEALKSGINIHLMGYMSQEEIACYLLSSDYMILPSSSEGFGKVFIESIACGTKVIIPRSLPLANEGDILNEKNAIFMGGFEKEDIFEVLEKLLPAKSNRNLISRTVCNLSWDYSAQYYTDFINKLIKTC